MSSLRDAQRAWDNMEHPDYYEEDEEILAAEEELKAERQIQAYEDER